MAFVSIDLFSAISTFFVFYFIWTVYTIVYNVFFHPLANLPGPRYAAASYLYEWYYDLYLSGQFTFKLKELHQQYGKS